MKKIIFGAGNYGRMAYEYYGDEDIAYFVDNNSQKVGKECCGKKILSFEEYKAVHMQYETVIAVSAYAQIARQLSDAGINRFFYFSPQYREALERIKSSADAIAGKIAFYGLDDCTEVLINDVIQCGIDVNDICLISGNEHSGIHIPGIREISFEHIKHTVDTVIISSAEHSYLLQAKANSLKQWGIHVINPFIPQKYYETKEVVFNPYTLNHKDMTEKEWNEINCNSAIIDEINRYAEELNRLQPMFEYIEIETINRCNGICDFCPVSVKHEIRERKLMDRRLFEKIIGELAELNYSGHLALFSNNEPFLDQRIIEFHQYARAMLPNARMHLFTNGSLLTLDKFIQIMECLDELIIDNYNQELQLNKNSAEIAKYCDEHAELKSKVTIVLRKPHEILTSRGGDAPNRKEIAEFPNAKCVLPFLQMIVRPDGKLSLCCNDPYGKATLGDLNKQTVKEAWYGEDYRKIREILLTGRGSYAHCTRCDTFYIY